MAFLLQLICNGNIFDGHTHAHTARQQSKSVWRLGRKLADIKCVINSLKCPHAQPYVAYERYLMKSHKANANDDDDYDDNGNERQGQESERAREREYKNVNATDAVHNPNDNINANLITEPCLSMSALVFGSRCATVLGRHSGIC